MSEESRPKWQVVGQIDIKILLCFVFGVIFIFTLLLFTIFIKNPNQDTVWIYRVVLALAAAGFAAMLPGFLNVQYKSLLQAGGALGVFALVLFGVPTPNSTTTTTTTGGTETVPPPPPKSSAEPVALRYLALADGGSLAEAFASLDPAAGHRWEEFKEAYRVGRNPLGAPLKRELMGVNQGYFPPGNAAAPPGHYKYYLYRTRFAVERKCRQENVVLRAVDGETWKVGAHNVSPTTIDC